MDLSLVAKIFHVVCVMNVLLSATHCANIYVSNRDNATKNKNCGSSEDDPCRTINAAVEIAKDYYKITIIATENKYDKDCPINVHRPLAFEGIRGIPIIDCGDNLTDAFIFNFDPKAEDIKDQPVIKLDVSNLKVQNAKTGFSFSQPTSNVNLRLENITFTNNEVDVSWNNKSPLCYLVMTNVSAFGPSGIGIEIEGCNKTTVKLVKTNFNGKYFKVVSTLESSYLDINMDGVKFDMSSRAKEIQFHSPMHIVTALERTSVTIRTSEFSNHIGHRNGMINITAFQKAKKGYTSPIDIKFIKVSFSNNTSLHGVGGAVSFNLSNKLTKKKKHSIEFQGCTFTGNSASNGGAVWFSKWEKKSVPFTGCTFKYNKALGKDTTGNGGALFALSGKFYLKSCKFEGNMATKAGGTLYLSNKKATSITITDSVFQNKQRSWSRIEGDVMYFDDVQTQFLGKVVFNLSSPNSGESMFFYEGKPSVLRMSNASAFVCPKGYNYDESKNTLPTRRNSLNYFPAYHKFAFSCKPCQDLFYSTTRGIRQVNGTETRGKCHACPYGASCNGTIRARANFWGMVKEDKVEMIPCPKGYCCDREPCESYESCRAHRTGTLCGHCSDGFTEGMSSTQCFPNEKCNKAWWMWPIGNVIGIFCIICLHQEIIKKLGKWSLWNDDDDDEDDETVEYRGNERNHNLRNTEPAESNSLLSVNPREIINTENVSLELLRNGPDYTHIEESSDYNNSGGYIKVFYYFYQAILLIRLSSYVSSSSTPNNIIDLLTPLLNFQFTNIWNCAGEGLRPVTKIFVKNSVGYWVLGFSLIMYGMYRLVRYCRKIYIDDEPGFRARSFPVRLIGTVMHVILLSYVAQTQFTVQLLNCVNVGDENVLYIDGSVACYRPYQIAVWLYFVFYILAFPFSLLVGQRLLISRRISWKEFIVSCFFPFIFLCYWGYKYIKHRNGDISWPQMSKVSDPFKDKIEYILQYPYKSRAFPNAKVVEHCSENWEAFLIFRRFVLVLVFIFVKSFLLRAYLFFIVSMLFLLAHVFVQPFKNDNVNKLDNISLAVIVLISGLSISEATYNNAGQLVPYDVEILQNFQDWFLALLPFVLLGIFFFPKIKYHFLRWKNRPRSLPVPTDDVSETVVSNPSIADGRLADEASPLTA